MADKDCSFIFCYLICCGSLFIFIAGFSTHKWMLHSEGHIGLWQNCRENNASGDTECSASPLIEGPAFLDGARTLCSFTLLFYIVAFCASLMQQDLFKADTAWQIFKARLQEICFTLGGALTMLGCIWYGVDYYDHYTQTKGLEDVSLEFSFFLCSITASVSFFSGIAMFFSRDLDLKLSTSKQSKSMRNLRKGAAKDRKKWLFGKSKVATPTDQKEDLASSFQMSTKEDAVTVKEGRMKGFLSNTYVVLAAKRFKDGLSKHKAKHNNADASFGQKTEDILIPANTMYKGIFTISEVNINEESTSVSMSTSQDSARGSGSERERSLLFQSKSQSLECEAAAGTIEENKVPHQTHAQTSQNPRQETRPLTKSAQEEDADGCGDVNYTTGDKVRPLGLTKRFSESEVSLRQAGASLARPGSSHDPTVVPRNSRQVSRHTSEDETKMRAVLNMEPRKGPETQNLQIYNIPAEPSGIPHEKENDIHYDVVCEGDRHAVEPVRL